MFNPINHFVVVAIGRYLPFNTTYNIHNICIRAHNTLFRSPFKWSGDTYANNKIRQVRRFLWLLHLYRNLRKIYLSLFITGRCSYFSHTHIHAYSLSRQSAVPTPCLGSFSRGGFHSKGLIKDAITAGKALVGRGHLWWEETTANTSTPRPRVSVARYRFKCVRVFGREKIAVCIDAKHARAERNNEIAFCIVLREEFTGWCDELTSSMRAVYARLPW